MIEASQGTRTAEGVAEGWHMQAAAHGNGYVLCCGIELQFQVRQDLLQELWMLPLQERHALK